MKKRKIEVFTAGCPVCEPVVQWVKDIACDSCEVQFYDLNQGCETNECFEKVKVYGIDRLPAVVVDGKLLDCCAGEGITKASLQAAGIGSSLG